MPEPSQQERWAANYIQTADIDATETEGWFNGDGWKPIGEDDNDFTGSYNGYNYIISNLFIDRNDYTGLFGKISNCEIKNLKVFADVSGDKFIGMVAGAASYSNIINCHVSGILNGTLIIGGIIGNSGNNSIKQCSNRANINGEKSGGITGKSVLDNMVNCFNFGNISGEEYVGGLVGRILQSTVTNCCSIGIVTADDDTGGLIGFKDESTITSCYWDTETSGINISAGGEARTTEEMTYPYAENTYVDWEFGEVWLTDEDYSNNDGYPYLNPTSMGDIISYTETTGPIPLEVEFTINQPEEEYVYNWDADGDGNYDGNGAVFSFIYNQVGNYTIELQVNPPNLESFTSIYPDLVEANLSFEAEAVEENSNLYYFSVNEPFTDFTYKWDADGDGEIDGTGTEFSYLYEIPDIYTVTLQAFSGDELLGSAQQEVNLLQFNSQWVTIEPCEGLVPLEIDIEHSYEDPYYLGYLLKLENTDFPEYEIQTGNWDENLVIDKIGHYNGIFFGLWEMGPDICTDFLESFDNCLYVKGAEFTASDYEINTGDNISIDADYEFYNIEEYKWDFNNDGEIDSYEAYPSYTYTQPGSYQINLTLDTEEGEITYTDEQTVYVSGEFLDLHQQYSIPFTNLEITENTHKEISKIDYNNDGKEDFYISVKKEGYKSVTIMGKEGNILYEEELEYDPAEGNRILFVTEFNGTHYRAYYDTETLKLTNLDTEEEYYINYPCSEMYDIGLFLYENSINVASCYYEVLMIYQLEGQEFVLVEEEYVSGYYQSGSWWSAVDCLNYRFYQNNISIIDQFHSGSDIESHTQSIFAIYNSNLVPTNSIYTSQHPAFTYCNTTNSYKVCDAENVLAYSNYYYNDEEMLIRYKKDDSSVVLKDLDGNFVATETVDLNVIGMANCEGQLLAFVQDNGQLLVYTDGEEFVSNQPEQVPISNTTLYQNYPNPFNPQTSIEFALKEPGKVELSIYNLKGQKVCTLVDQNLPADKHSIVWNGRDEHNNRVASGIYFYRLQTARQVITKKMMLLK
ncbi:MAG: PKD domain-containing protein [Candidatus Cloacimonadota bacterium]|nr:PKD domain-containing protein [Candidatus Cloacimonadota bacterium]